MAFVVNQSQNLNINIQDKDTGKDVVSNANIIAKKNDVFASVEKLNARYYMKDFSEIMATICKSQKDIKIFFGVLNYINDENLMLKQTMRLQELIQNKIGDTFSKIRLNSMLNDMVKVGFSMKLGNGKYFFNPFIVTGKNQSTKQLEIVQGQWKATVSCGTYVSRSELVDMINANSAHVNGVAKQVVNWIEYDKKYSPSLTASRKVKKILTKTSSTNDVCVKKKEENISEEAKQAFH